jgi:hypothetical protein
MKYAVYLPMGFSSTNQIAWRVHPRSRPLSARALCALSRMSAGVLQHSSCGTWADRSTYLQKRHGHLIRLLIEIVNLGKFARHYITCKQWKARAQQEGPHHVPI